MCLCVCWICLADFAKHFCTLHPPWQLQLLHKYIFCICHAHFTIRRLRLRARVAFLHPLLLFTAPTFLTYLSLALSAMQVKWKCKSSPAVVAPFPLLPHPCTITHHVQYKNTLASYYVARIENLSTRREIVCQNAFSCGFGCADCPVPYRHDYCPSSPTCIQKVCSHFGLNRIASFGNVPIFDVNWKRLSFVFRFKRISGEFFQLSMEYLNDIWHFISVQIFTETETVCCGTESVFLWKKMMGRVSII